MIGERYDALYHLWKAKLAQLHEAESKRAALALARSDPKRPMALQWAGNDVRDLTLEVDALAEALDICKRRCRTMTVDHECGEHEGRLD